VFVSPEKIQEQYDALQSRYKKSTDADDLTFLKKCKKAFECLDSTKCRDQYTRFGVSIDIDSSTPDFEMDWKMGFSVFFYILFAFVHAAMATVEQKPGLRFGMGVGIMFCTNEIQLLSAASMQIKEGKSPDAAVQTLLSLFPTFYSTFEVIVLLRIFFFAVFSIINSVSLIFGIDEAREKAYLSDLVKKQQMMLTKKCSDLYQLITNDKLNIYYEMRKE
jgi:hypothetical protein